MLRRMTVVHANDPTTRALSLLYEAREDVSCRVAEKSTSSDVRRAIRDCDTVMMLGHGNEWGLFSTPDKKGRYERHIISSKLVDFLRGKTCIGIWCHGAPGFFRGSPSDHHSHT